MVPENPLKEYTDFICLLCKNVISAAVIQEYHTESMALLKCLEIAGLQKVVDQYHSVIMALYKNYLLYF